MDTNILSSLLSRDPEFGETPRIGSRKLQSQAESFSPHPHTKKRRIDYLGSK